MRAIFSSHITNSPSPPVNLKLIFAGHSQLRAGGAAAQHPVRGHVQPGAVHVHRPGLHPPGHARSPSQDCSSSAGQGSDRTIC